MMKILIHNPAFRRFVAGQFASVVGDGLYLIAILWWVKQETGDNAKVALLSLCALVPTVLLGILGGAIIDRTNQKRMMIAMDLLRAGLLLVLGALHFSGHLTFPLLCGFAVALSVASAFFRPGLNVVLVDLVPKEQLPVATSLNQMVFSLGSLIGPALGGVLVAVTSLTGSILLNALTFVISALLLRRLPLQPRAAPRAQQHLWTDITDGFGYLARQPLLLLMLATFCGVNFVLAPLPVMLPALTHDVLRAGPSSYGWLEAAVTGGAVIGGILAGLVKSQRLLLVLTMQIMLAGSCLLLISVSSHLLEVMGLLVLTGAGFALSSTLVATVFQTTVPREYLGRVFGMIGTASLALRPLALLVLLPVVKVVTAPQVFAAAGAALLILALGVGLISTALQRRAAKGVMPEAV